MYTVGQKLWLVPVLRSFGGPHEVTITKVGRKWLTLNNAMRADIDGLCLDGGEYASPGACYLSKESWELAEENRRAWNKLRHDVSLVSRIPSGLTAETIRDARKLLLLGETP